MAKSLHVNLVMKFAENRGMKIIKRIILYRPYRPRQVWARLCLLSGLLLGVTIAGANDDATAPREGEFVILGTLQNPAIDEASGIQAAPGGVFFVHNDEKRDVFVIDSEGRHLGAFKLDKSKNRDWEDITRIPGEDPLLVIADTGDNAARRDNVQLYFFAEPADGHYDGEHTVSHRLELSYPDGPRDVESVAYDAHSDSILLLSKRNEVPRLYSVSRTEALTNETLEATFLGEVRGLRAPTRQDLLNSLKRGMWVSQPTAMDISADGRKAAVLTYRSLYIYERDEGQSWIEAFGERPVEYIGPPGTHDEAVCFSLDGREVYVTTERRPAPIYRLLLD